MKTAAARTLALLAWVCCCAGFAHAHTLGASELKVDSQSGDSQVQVRWDLAILDLYTAIDLDADGDGNVTAGELQGARPRIAREVLPQLGITRGGNACTLQLQDYLVEERLDGFHALLQVAARCQARGAIGVDYRFLFDADRSHRAVVRLREDGRDTTAVLSPDSRRWQPERASALAAFFSFIRQGIHHIWIGYDHVAFLVLLLLPSVLRARRGAWESATTLREVAWRILRIVTAFTAAHSITLSLATLGLVVPPERPIEIAIAGSVVLAGLMNLVPALAARAAAIAFAFGLVHGFGFANVLAQLGLHDRSLAASLAGFNIGVELGQLAIVLLLLPLIFRLRAAEFYRRRFLPAASLATAMVALGWLLERSA